MNQPRDLGPEVRSGLLAANAAKAVYYDAAKRLFELAALELSENKPLTSAITRKRAEIALRAAKAEDT